MPIDTKGDTKRQNRFITLEKVLFEFVEPMVLLYKSGKTYFFASALPSENGFVEEYLIVSVTPKVCKRYFRQDVDLRFLYESNPNRSFFKIAADCIFKERIKAIPYDGKINEEMLPAPQFFASSHTAEYMPMSRPFDALETLYIDGNWEMEDFGKFSARYRDIYSFEQAISKLSSKSTSVNQRKKLSAAFQGNTLQGGGSYVSLFKDLSRLIPANEQYDLDKVQYASPGKIELRGKGTVFDRLEQHVTNMIGNDYKIRRRYNELHEYMSKAGLLDVTQNNPTPSDKNLKKITSLSKKLLSEMKLELFEVILKETGGNTVNSAKICMAVFRRIRAASMFFAEGRAVYER